MEAANLDRSEWDLTRTDNPETFELEGASWVPTFYVYRYYYLLLALSPP
jgi:hypothetical protein